MKTVIKVENLSKMYQIGAKEARRDNLREVIVDTLKAPFRRFRKLRGDDGNGNNTFWALKDVSFEVQEGEVVGIIGRNGAGKSTLLKILSRITEPTEGRVKIKGRVASLLEVGTGFHPELTGRENIYLNGSILGMTRVEINRKFDEIVEFSEIEKFLDTPVKRYSSGMYVRLAFAVAAHLDPEILIVDEVLAVGDTAFQKKCLGKMQDVSKGGRTVLFVSHNMAAIQSLCRTSIVINSGTIHFKGMVDEGVKQYLSTIGMDSLVPVKERKDRSGSGQARIIDIDLTDSNGKKVTQLLSGDDISIVIKLLSNELFLRNITIMMTIYDQTGYAIAHMNNLLTGNQIDLQKGECEACCKISELPLRAGSYYINGAVMEDGVFCDHLEKALQFEVVESDFFKTGKAPPPYGPPVLLHHAWESHNQNGQ